MPAMINGLVYDDLNKNGQNDIGEPGISSVYVILYSTTGGFTTVQTDPNGNYSFTITTPGAYTVYETAIQPGACPPTAGRSSCRLCSFQWSPDLGCNGSMPLRSRAMRSFPAKTWSQGAVDSPFARLFADDLVCEPSYPVGTT